MCVFTDNLMTLIKLSLSTATQSHAAHSTTETCTWIQRTHTIYDHEQSAHLLSQDYFVYSQVPTQLSHIASSWASVLSTNNIDDIYKPKEMFSFGTRLHNGVSECVGFNVPLNT